MPLRRPSAPLGGGRRVEQLARAQFRGVTDDIRAAARIPRDRSLAPENVRALCAHGLETIFGSS
ncbi:MAG TPA: hypothetical protein VEX86_17945 [Longimicrobium sp.]|nr:hypothetical protein [Longimicrobium sp.]